MGCRSCSAFFFLLLPLSICLTVAEPAKPPLKGGCTDQLIWFFPCLPYVSSSPNNLTETASTKCCDAFSSSFAPNSLCFCHLLRDPHILGFPLNSTRLLSLSSLCLSPPPTTSSFDFLCAASPALPPLSSAETLGAIRSPPVSSSAAGTGSNGGGGGGGRESMEPQGTRAGSTFYFPSLNGSTSTLMIGGGYYKSILLSQILAIFFVTL